jgi:hypothetical protein
VFTQIEDPRDGRTVQAFDDAEQEHLPVRLGQPSKRFLEAGHPLPRGGLLVRRHRAGWRHRARTRPALSVESAETKRVFLLVPRDGQQPRHQLGALPQPMGVARRGQPGVLIDVLRLGDAPAQPGEEAPHAFSVAPVDGVKGAWRRTSQGVNELMVTTLQAHASCVTRQRGLRDRLFSARP